MKNAPELSSTAIKNIRRSLPNSSGVYAPKQNKKRAVKVDLKNTQKLS